jgi:hypothetical protein
MKDSAGPRGVLLGLALSALALAIAPLFLPETYFPIANTTSESAAQGVEWAWIARIGLAAFGLSVLGFTRLPGMTENSIGRWCFDAFGLLLILSAIASTRSWVPDARFDPSEDWVHSFAATAMGFAFAFGVVATVLSRAKGVGRLRVHDILAVAASVLIPLGMIAVPEVDGLLQRLMFAIAFAWFALETIAVRTGEDRAVGQPRGQRPS